MLSLRSNGDLADALSAHLLEPVARDLLLQRRDQLAADDLDLADIAHVIVVRPGDTLKEVEAAIGVSISIDLDGVRLGDRDFTPPFEFVHRHGWWLEAVLILSDDGFGVVLLVPDRIDVDPALLSLLGRCLT